nr:DUF3019 domain-containing protein [Shewanella nanhaiensis]
MLLSLFIVGSSQIFADEADELGAKLTVSPEFCITSGEQLTCDLKVLLEWKNQQPRAICILSDYENMAKWCAEDDKANSLSLNVSTTEDIQFVMIDKETHETLAGVKLKVTQTAEPKVRRRFRNPWSLF